MSKALLLSLLLTFGHPAATSVASAQCSPKAVPGTTTEKISDGSCQDKEYKLGHYLWPCNGNQSWDSTHPVNTTDVASYPVLGSCFSSYYNCSCGLVSAGSVSGSIEGNVAYGDQSYCNDCGYVWWKVTDLGRPIYARCSQSQPPQPDVDCGGGNWGEVKAYSPVIDDYIDYHLVWF